MAEQWAQLLFETCERGISSAVSPELLPDTQVAWAGNVTARGGKPYTRPPWILRADLPRGLIQGGEYFGIQGGMLVVSIAGHMFRIRINNRHFEVDQISLDFENSGVLKQVWMCQTVETLVIQDGQSDAILYNGSVAPRATGNQVPRGKMMAYGNGRLWLAINDKELIAGDIRTRNAGSELKFTETNYLTGGGSLYFPRGLTGLSFIPVTGQADYGALLAFGLDYSKAIRADVTQRDQWASIPGFEQSILNSVGSAGQWPIVSVNQDLYWRDSNGGIRSIRNALADEQGPGSSPVSREVSRLTDYDSQQLMPWCSGVYHDNRLLMTSSPYLLANGGIGWKNLIALDFAPLSTLQGKSQAAYDGQWTGLPIVKLLGGNFRNKNRAFALTTDDDGNNQLWETGGPDIADITGLCENPFANVPNPIRSWVEYPRRNFGLSKNRKRLERCDVWLSNVDGELDLAVYWRADNSQKWLQWDAAETCAKTTDASTESPHAWKNLLPQERPQFKTFTIPQNINELVGYAAEVGFEFQIRLVWTGFAKIHRMMTYGTVLEDPNFAMRDEFQAVCIENDVSGNQVVYNIPTSGCPSMLVSQGETHIQPEDVFNVGYDVFAPIDTIFTITNNGIVELTLGTLTNTPDSNFTIISQPPVTSLAPGESTHFTVRYENNISEPESQISIPNSSSPEPFLFDVAVTVVTPETIILVVAGGGSGGQAKTDNIGNPSSTVNGGGGGGGGYSETILAGILALDSYDILVGAGALPNANYTGNNGADSHFIGGAYTIVRSGGGGGGGISTFGNIDPDGLGAGLPGGSGGGGSGWGVNRNGGFGDVGQGNQGGVGISAAPFDAPGGGGGAGNVGADGVGGSHAGAGGAGLSSVASGTLQFYAGGGGGAYSADVGRGLGGSGSGGNGAGNTLAAGSGVRGGGGGGGNLGGGFGGSGGDGIVIIRYPGPAIFTGGVITTVGPYTVHTFTANGTLTPA